MTEQTPSSNPANNPATGPPVDTLALQRDLVSGMMSQSLRALITVSLVGTAFFLVFQRDARSTALAWYLVFLAVQLANLKGWFDFRRLQQAPNWDPGPQQRRILRVAMLNGAILGAAGWLFSATTFESWVVFTIIIVCGSAAASIHFYAYQYRAMLAFLLLLSLPLELRFFTNPYPGGLVAGIMFALYIMAVGMFGRHQARLIHASFRMRYENLALIDMLKTQAQALQELSQAKTRFFAAASHDLRQPVQALGYYLSLLKPASHEQAHVDRMAQCLDSMEELLEAVLDITRLDAGHVLPRRSVTNLHDLLQRQTSLYEGVAAAKQLQLRLHVPAQTAWTDTDPALLERILANLVNNAIRYTDRGGVLLALKKKQECWAIAVFDTGCGIEAAALDDIFQEFTQLENPQRNRSRGVGLGLSIVQRICNLLELPLNVRSVVGKGSRFEVMLPVAQAPGLQLAPVSVTAQGQLQGRILLVEDDPLVQESLASVLNEWGLETHCAADGEQALALARQHQYDGVISDWRLPGHYNGSAFLAALLPLQPQLKMRILLTGEHHESNLVPGDGVLLLRKPVRPIRLRAMLTAFG